MDNKGLRYIRYSRKSQESSEKQALSIEDQNLECDGYASRLGLNLVHKIEESKSAYKPHRRPLFNQAIEMIKLGRADAFLAWSPNRLCRNPEEGGMLLQMLQDGLLKEIRTSSGDVYTPESDHLVLQIHFGIANQFSRNLSRDVKRGMTHKAERGEYTGPAPIGFEGFGEERRRNIRPHPLEGPIIRKAFELVGDEERSLGYVCEHLAISGLKTKRGKEISKSQLYYILTNPTYYGQFRRNGILYQGEYEPLIDYELFEKTQIALGIKTKPKINSWGNKYSSVIKCGECGCVVTSTVKNKYYKGTDRSVTYIYDHCTHRRGSCNQKPITRLELESQLTETLQNLTIDEEAWSLGMSLFNAKHNHETKRDLTRLTYLQIQYASVQESLSNLIRMRAAQEITLEQFMKEKAGYEREEKRIEGLMKENKYSFNNWLERCEEFLNNAFLAKEIMEGSGFEAKLDLVTKVGQNLTLKDGKINFTFDKPYDVCLKPFYRTNWLPD